MSLEENKAIIRSLIEALNKRDLALLDELMALNMLTMPFNYEVWKFVSTQQVYDN